MNTKLPPLPEPALPDRRFPSPGDYTGAYFTADQMREYALAARSHRPAGSDDSRGGWISDRLPETGQEVLVWSQQSWEKEPSIKIDAWDEIYEAPVSFSTVTVPVGHGWRDHDDMESVIAWQPLPEPPAARSKG